MSPFGTSGYLVTLVPAPSGAVVDPLERLRATDWIGPATRAVALSLTLLNAATNVVVSLRVMLETNASGVVTGTLGVVGVSVAPDSTDWQPITLGGIVGWMGLLSIWTTLRRSWRAVIELCCRCSIKNRCRSTRAAGEQPPNLACIPFCTKTVATLLLATVVVLTTQVWQDPIRYSTESRSTLITIDQQDNLYDLGRAVVNIRSVLVALLLVMAVAAIRALRVISEFELLYKAVSEAVYELTSCCVATGILLLFIIVCSWLMFASQLEAFETFLQSVGSLTIMTVNEAKQEDLLVRRPSIATTVFMIITGAVLTAVILIMTGAFTKAWEQASREAKRRRTSEVPAVSGKLCQLLIFYVISGNLLMFRAAANRSGCWQSLLLDQCIARLIMCTSPILQGRPKLHKRFIMLLFRSFEADQHCRDLTGSPLVSNLTTWLHRNASDVALADCGDEIHGLDSQPRRPRNPRVEPVPVAGAAATVPARAQPAAEVDVIAAPGSAAADVGAANDETQPAVRGGDDLQSIERQRPTLRRMFSSRSRQSASLLAIVERPDGVELFHKGILTRDQLISIMRCRTVAGESAACFLPWNNNAMTIGIVTNLLKAAAEQRQWLHNRTEVRDADVGWTGNPMVGVRRRRPAMRPPPASPV